MRAAVLAVAVVMALGAQTLAVDQVPPPSLAFERLCLPQSEAYRRYSKPFTAENPTLAVGSRFLSGRSGATLGVPQVEWFLSSLKAETELLSCEEAEQDWQTSPGIAEWRAGRFPIVVMLYGDDLDNLLPSPQGRIQRFILETSTGERLVGQPMTRADFDVAPGGGFEATHMLVFDRRRAFAPGVEWLRLHVATSTSRMYFEWRFAEPLPQGVGES